MKRKQELSLKCLDSKKISLESLKDLWNTNYDKRKQEHYILKFLRFNEENFGFLGITGNYSYEGNAEKLKSEGLVMKASHYVGAVSMVSPVNGRQIGDLHVLPRYTDQDKKSFVLISSLVEQMGDENVQLEYLPTMPLLSDNLRPPLYYDGLKYIDLFDKALKTKWTKFNKNRRLLPFPKSSTNWERYINRIHDPRNRLIYPCEDNVLSQNHKEMEYLCYVYGLARDAVLSSQTPQKIRLRMQEKIGILDKKSAEIRSSSTNLITVRASDPHSIKDTKNQANVILQNKKMDSLPWRVDLQLLFEKYAQFIIEKAVWGKGIQVFKNKRFNKSKGNLPSWGLSYLEPDIVLKKEDHLIMIDAKYKSHMYNLSASQITSLNEEHRKDLHQLLCYCSFSTMKDKNGLFFFPSNEFHKIEVEYSSNVTYGKNRIIYVGIPFDADKTKETISKTAVVIEAVLRS